MKNFRKTILVLLIAFVSCFGSTSTASACIGMWGDGIPGACLKQALEVVYDNIQGAKLGALKMTAMNMINSQIGQLIGGGATGAPRFITNWQDALYMDPEREAQLYMNDFFTLTTRGMASSANYVGTGDFGIGGGNYAQYLTRVGESAISGGQYNTMTIHEYTPSPEVMFENGDWNAFYEFTSNPLNNPPGYALAAQQAKATFIEQQRDIARTQAIAYQGFEGVKGAGGTVTTPGITIKDLVSDANNLPNMIVSGATKPSELIASLAVTAATKAINGLVQQGIGEVQSKIAQQIGISNNQAQAIINGATKVLGPGAVFSPAVQRAATEATIKVRSYTGPTVYADP